MRDTHAGISSRITILSGDLAAGGKLEDVLGGGVKLAFTMGDWDMVEVVDLAVGEPWREIGGHPGRDVAGDMTSDIVEGKGRGFRFRVPNFAVRY